MSNNSSEKTRAGYRDRLHDGDVVYFVEGESVMGTGPLTVKKGSVDDTCKRRYPTVLLWNELDKDPNGSGTVVTKSPRALFTETEVRRATAQHEGTLGIDERPIDALITDPLACRELTAVLGSVVISRLAQDELRKPCDPEY